MFIESLISTFCWHLYSICLNKKFDLGMVNMITSNTNVVSIILFSNFHIPELIPYVSIGYFIQNSYLICNIPNFKDTIAYIFHHVVCIYGLISMTLPYEQEKIDCIEIIFYYFEGSNLMNYINYYLIKSKYKYTIIVDISKIIQFITYTFLRFFLYKEIYNCGSKINNIFIFIYFFLYSLSIIMTIRLFKQSIESSKNIIKAILYYIITPMYS